MQFEKYKEKLIESLEAEEKKDADRFIKEQKNSTNTRKNRMIQLTRSEQLTLDIEDYMEKKHNGKT